MAANSRIEWTDVTWNPVTGCTPVSPGCLNCYAARDAARMAGNPNPRISGRYRGLAVVRDGRPVFNGTIRLHEDRLSDPLRWRKPRMIFVNSQSDLFHEDVPFDFIDRIFAAMALCPQHTFQVLTKRPERMAQYRVERISPGWGAWEEIFFDLGLVCEGQWDSVEQAGAIDRLSTGPLSNVWLGASAENQECLDERMPHLLRVPAAVRFLSLEPLLGPINLTIANAVAAGGPSGSAKWIDALRGVLVVSTPVGEKTYQVGGIDWVIVGGESGPHARACNVAWIRDIVRQCKAASVPCFVKQVGSRPVDMNGDGELRRGIVDVAENMRRAVSDRKGGDPSEWPAELRVREWPGDVARC